MPPRDIVLDFAMMSQDVDDRRHACPKCGSEMVRRSLRSGFIENLIYPLFGLRPYRCMACEERFIDRRGAGGRKEIHREEKP